MTTGLKYRMVRIDSEVYEALQRQAIPLVDNINSVLRKVLGLSSTLPIKFQPYKEDVKNARP